MKKGSAFILVLAMVNMLTACGKADMPATQGTVSGGGEEMGTAAAESPQPAEFQELTVVDDEFCTIRITDIDPDNLWGYTLGVYLENKSADAAYVFSVEAASVNGVDTDPLFASEVAPGKKANGEISFADPVLEENGVGEFTDIRLNFRVYDANDWTADPVAEAGIHVYPKGEENARAFVREAQSSDKVVVDNDKVTITVTGYREDEIWGYTADLFIENKTEAPIMVTANEVSVNGYMADPYYAESVSGGSCAFSSISWMDTVLEENGITQVETVELKLRVYPSEDWMAEDYANETVMLTPGE